MIQEPFLQANSPMRRMDARVKIVTAFLFSMIVAIAQDPIALSFGFMLAVAMVIIARLPFVPLMKRMLTLNVFVLLVWLVLPITANGQEVTSVGPLVLREEGVKLALLITVKSNSILLVLTALLATSPIFSIVHGLDHLGLPKKLVQLFYFSWRYVHEITKEFFRLRRAMKVRCFKPRSNIHTYRSYGYLISTLLIRSFDRSERVYDAMVLRGFSGRIPAYHHPKMRPADVAALVILITAVLAVGGIEWDLINRLFI